jgi:hypothetical protein
MKVVVNFLLGGMNNSIRFTLAPSVVEYHNRTHDGERSALKTIRALPDNCSLEDIAECLKLMAAVQKGLHQLDRGESIPHDEIKRQLALWLKR